LRPALFGQMARSAAWPCGRGSSRPGRR